MNISRLNKMQYSIAGAIAFAMLLAADVQASATFKRPDCSVYNDHPKPAQKCIREVKSAIQLANQRSIQDAGLEFVYMGRPDAEGNTAVERVLEDEVEGSFAIRYSVGTDGKVYDLKVVETTPDAVSPLATLWAEAIQNWSFVPMEKPALDIEFRRIYLYAPEDEKKNKTSAKE